ncbi:ion transporter [Brevundimonas variabilis]|uniref:Voltage-gated potassium channel n=1 Tax=Brevundimonas variabilis TaxID=74312 RepID=A0A7W9FEN6_9CAUL|nr:ion transporter [Brevundimonas variabilis]MBB5744539.1 voltage-gated potassium channel [Brevundimonas variabilis]
MSETPKGLRARLHCALDVGRTGKLSALNMALIVAILLSVLVAVLDTEATIARPMATLFTGLDILFLVLFGVEYLARLWTAPETPRYAHPVWGRLRWMVSPAAIIDLLALAPALIFAGATPAYLFRLFRLLRILRLAKLGRFSRAWTLMAEAVASRRAELLLTLGAACMVMLVSACLLYLIEGESQPDKFGSIPRSLWWAVITMTTIGYGDVFPVTPLGKLVAALTAVAGIGLIAAPTGILAAAFSDAAQRHREAIEAECAQAELASLPPPPEA